MKLPVARAWPAIAIAVAAFAAAAGLERLGWLDRVENVVTDARARLLMQARESDIVIVGIDTQSLLALEEWPWPRSHHATLLRALESAKPQSIFLDINFSSRSPSGADDELLENALAAVRGTPVYLAAHYDRLAGDASARTLKKPIEPFLRHTQLASVVLEPSGDGLVREMHGSFSVTDAESGATETIAAMFAHADARWLDEAVPIDFSIALESFVSVSYIDVASREIADDVLRGKRVFVGPIAPELGDMIQVPVQGALPGVVVQALAAETARLPPVAVPFWLSTLSLAVVAALAGFLGETGTWRRNLLAAGACVAAAAGASVYLHSAYRVDLHVVPYALVAAGTFIAFALRSLDRERWRALSYALGVRRRDALLKSIVESSSDSIVCMDANLAIRTANPAALRLFGLSGPALLGQRLDALVPDLLTQRHDSLVKLAGRVLDCSARGRDGVTVPVEIAVSRIDVPNDPLFTAVIRDVSERHAQRRALEHQATHDSLTGLPNRAALHAHLELALARATTQPTALFMLDLTRFKEVNDTLGHDVGDEVLREVANRFEERLDDAFIARIGGDEFTVVVTDAASRETVDDLARSLLDGLRRPIDARGIAIDIGVNIGIAFAPGDAQTPKDLLRRADVAMYAAKRRGTGHEYYDSEHDQHSVRRLSMLSELRSAIENSGIALHYQPQVDLRTNRVASVEALVRWQHATHGAIGPSEFITLAESSDLIGPLTDWTITRTLQDLAMWNRQQLVLRAAVNVSARVLQDVDFPARVRELLMASPVRPDQLELEITESAMMVDPERARRIVDELHALGVAISIDDYGTGYSSLGYLRDLRVHALKLDRSFIVDLEKRAENRVIIESTVQMAHALGLTVVAEGVETETAASYLRTAGYDLAQGYWFARPMPAEDFSRFALTFNAAVLPRTA